MSISSFAQERMCYVGQHLVFEEASEMLESLTGTSINAKQIERICHLYGQWIEDQDIEKTEQEVSKDYNAEESSTLNYASVDGSMYYTRENGWKEIKLGRIFKASDMANLNKDRNTITKSTYVAHLGSHENFIPKMEYHLDGLRNVVFIADGAKWIWKWINDMYPNCIQILDFFHAKEHLCAFGKEYFKDETERAAWIEKLTVTLLEKTPSLFIEEIELLPKHQTKKVNNQKETLLQYYREHEKRINYKDFLEKGLQIGSGAIEAAHKDVLQQRLKLSGQRWTMKGLRQMAQLRAVYKSDEWNRITDLSKKAA